MANAGPMLSVRQRQGLTRSKVLVICAGYDTGEPKRGKGDGVRNLQSDAQLNSPHELWRDTHYRTDDVLAQNGQTEFLSDTPTSKQDGRCAIRDLRGIAGMSRAVLAECRLELGEGFLGYASSDSIVCVDNDFLFFLRLWVRPLDLWRGSIIYRSLGPR